MLGPARTAPSAGLAPLVEGAHVGEHRVGAGGDDEGPVRDVPGLEGPRERVLDVAGDATRARRRSRDDDGARCARDRARRARLARSTASTSRAIGTSVGARTPRKRCVLAAAPLADATTEHRARDAERATDHRDRRRAADSMRSHGEAGTERARRSSSVLPSGSVASASAAPPAFLTRSSHGARADLAGEDEVALAALRLHLDVLAGRRVGARDVGRHVERDEQELAARIVPRRQDRGGHREVAREEPRRRRRATRRRSRARPRG